MYSNARSSEHAREVAERKVIFLRAVDAWVKERRVEERLDREQLGKLDSLARLQSQRQSLLDNTAHFYAKHPKADTALGVLVLVTFFSDNNDGCCSLSVSRIAKFLSRSERRISDAIARLAEVHAISVEPVRGGTSRLFPWVHQSFGSTKDPIAWILDVRAPSQRSGQPGRPRNTPVDNVTPIFIGLAAGNKIPPTPLTITPDVVDQKPPTLPSPNTTKFNTTKLNTTHNTSATPSDRDTQALVAIELYNREAAHHDWTVCAIKSKDRIELLSKRLDEIGGVDGFARALQQIPNDPFLMGQIKPKDGGKPFKLNIDRLLSTRSGMGDILAKLLDTAASANAEAADWLNDPEIPIERWREEIFTHAANSGYWPVGKLGLWPGHRDSMAPAILVAELNLQGAFDNRGILLRGAKPNYPPKPDFWKDPKQVAAINDDQWRLNIATYANDIWPIAKLGPPPGDPQCVVPSHLVAELRLEQRFDQNGIRRRQ